MIHRKAFTLIELLTVIAIIAILATLVITLASTALAKARDAKRLTDIQQVQTALEAFYTDHGYFPPSSSCGASMPNGSWCNSLESRRNNQWINNGVDSLSSYLASMPTDPARITAFPSCPSQCFFHGAYYYFANGYGSSQPMSQWYMMVFFLDNFPSPVELTDGVNSPDGKRWDYGTDNNGLVTVGYNHELK